VNPVTVVIGCLVAASVWALLPAGRGVNSALLASALPKFTMAGRVTRPAKNGDTHAANLIFTEVASLLRAGVPPGAAWRRAAGVEVDSYGIPDQMALSAKVGGEAATAMAAASQLAVRLGAPLAQVLQSVDEALRTESQTRADREAALAGPQTTARVLLALPFLGLLLGWVLGANPVRVMLSGGVGTVVFALGAVMLLAGRWWIANLVNAAAAAGGSGAPP